MTDKVYIPTVEDGYCEDLFSRIKPVVSFNGVKCHIKPVHLHNTAYTWDAKKAEPAGELVPIADITTYHSYGYYGFFKPSIGEVLKQIPAEFLDQVVAFEIVDSPQTSDDLNKHSEALNAGYHVATTRLYRK